MPTVEQIRDELHPSLRGQFEDAVMSVITDAAKARAWRECRAPQAPHEMYPQAFSATANEVWDMDIDELIDVADTEIASLLEDLIH